MPVDRRVQTSVKERIGQDSGKAVAVMNGKKDKIFLTDAEPFHGRYAAACMKKDCMEDSQVAKSFLTKPPVISTISSAEQNITVLSHPIGNDGQRQIRWGSNPLRVCRRNFERSLWYRPLFT